VLALTLKQGQWHKHGWSAICFCFAYTARLTKPCLCSEGLGKVFIAQMSLGIGAVHAFGFS
jgi:hypothetical protein